MKTRKHDFQQLFCLATITAVILFLACSKQTVEKSAQGAAMGAAVSAVGGMVTALVFGGNPAEAAARSAVYGASAGATAGAISGAMAEKKAPKTAADPMATDMQKLRQTLGEDAFSGLEALVDCKHEVAQAYGRTAAQSDNKHYALAGLWIQVITFADNREEEKARAMFPDLIAQDEKLTTSDQVEAKMRESLQKLMDIRQKNGRPRVCG